MYPADGQAVDSSPWIPSPSIVNCCVGSSYPISKRQTKSIAALAREAECRESTGEDLRDREIKSVLKKFCILRSASCCKLLP